MLSRVLCATQNEVQGDLRLHGVPVSESEQNLRNLEVGHKTGLEKDAGTSGEVERSGFGIVKLGSAFCFSGLETHWFNWRRNPSKRCQGGISSFKTGACTCTETLHLYIKMKLITNQGDTTTRRTSSRSTSSFGLSVHLSSD